jgi:hypothetical protein
MRDHFNEKVQSNKSVISKIINGIVFKIARGARQAAKLLLGSAGQGVLF